MYCMVFIGDPRHLPHNYILQDEFNNIVKGF